MKKIIIMICVVSLSIMMTFYQIHIIKKQTLQSFHDVVILSKSVEEGTTLKASDLEMGKINTLWYSSDYYTSIEEVVGLNITTDLSKYSILSKQILTETVDDQMITEANHAMTTLKLLPEQALCYRLTKGDQVAVYYVDGLTEACELGTVTIKGIFDSNIADVSLPTYLLVEADQGIIERIISLRENGRFEVIRKESYE